MSLVIGLVLLPGSIGSPAAAAAASTRTCQDPSGYVSRFAAATPTVGAIVGARADFGPIASWQLQVCTDPGGDLYSGSLVWAAVIGPVGSSANAIDQVGVLNCPRDCGAYWPTAGEQMFWAWGRSQSDPGCSGFSNHIPAAHEAGAPPSALAQYDVRKLANGTWNFEVGGAVLLNVGGSAACWANGHQRTQFACETWDGGDQCGGDLNHPGLTLDNVTYQNAVGGAWLPSNLTQSMCYASITNYHCDVNTSTEFYVWTYF